MASLGKGEVGIELTRTGYSGEGHRGTRGRCRVGICSQKYSVESQTSSLELVFLGGGGDSVALVQILKSTR